MIALLVLGCGGSSDDGDADDVAAPTGDTGAPSVVLGASCDRQQGNELRFVCRVDLAEPGPVELTVEPEDGSEPPRTFLSPEAATDHELVVWDLVGETRYRWAVSSAGAHGPTGTTRTGTAPSGLAVELVPVLDGPTSIDRVLIPYSCGGDGQLVAIDGQGTIRWYSTSFPPISLNGFNVSDRGSAIAVVGRSRVVESSFDGTPRIDLDSDALLDPVHHDAVARFGRTGVLNARERSYDDGLSYVIDGFYELDAGGVIGEWDVGEALDPRGYGEPQGSYWSSMLGGAIDFGHANSLDVDARGVWLVSFKHLDTVMAIRDGQVWWTLAGGSRAVEPGTLALGSSVGLDASFEYQHNAHWSDEDTILLVDNGREDGDWTRILEIDIDELAGTADVVGEFVMTGARCPIQSSGYKLADGTVLGACTANRRLYEFDPDGTLRREVVAACNSPSALQAQLLRAIPIDL